MLARQQRHPIIAVLQPKLLDDAPTRLLCIIGELLPLLGFVVGDDKRVDGARQRAAFTNLDGLRVPPRAIA